MVPSFSRDHTLIKGGTITEVSRKHIGFGVNIVKYDVRFYDPNRVRVLSVAAAHTIEHIVSDTLYKILGPNMIDFSPMGCMTGFYCCVILRGRKSVEEEIVEALKSVFDYEDIKDVPGVSPVSCGNYRLHNLEKAKISVMDFFDKYESND